MVASVFAVFVIASLLLFAMQHMSYARAHASVAAPAPTPAGPPASLSAKAESARSNADEIEVLECDTITEVADVLLQLGQVAAAQDILSEYIAKNPSQAIEPWLRLLEIHRRQDARESYELTAAKLVKHFNVHARPWEASPAGEPDALERYPHVMRELVHRWGTHACHHYLGRLLAANREGARRGFGPEVVEEILLLTAILEQAHLTKPAAQHHPGSRSALVLPVGADS